MILLGEIQLNPLVWLVHCLGKWRPIIRVEKKASGKREPKREFSSLLRCAFVG